jgi:sulfite exporter TauE/SafE
MNYWIIFLTGLTTGGLSCIALQGGLLASAIVESEDELNNKKKFNKARTILIFLGSKIIAYTILGLILGLIGKFVGLSPRATGILNLFIAIFMLGVAGEALKIHPLFRYFLIQPPKFIRKKIKRFKDNKGDFAAAILGLFTVLIPCGVTQAMMAYAISSANFASGAMIMFTFILGTIPVFFILAYLATSIGEKFQSYFKKFVALLLIALSIYTFIHAGRLLGWKIENSNDDVVSEQTIDSSVPQEITIKLNDTTGYAPSRIELKKGHPVKVTLVNDGANGCIRAFVIPSINKQVIVPDSGSTSFDFTPSKKGNITFTCSMGMYKGVFVVK